MVPASDGEAVGAGAVVGLAGVPDGSPDGGSVGSVVGEGRVGDSGATSEGGGSELVRRHRRAGGRPERPGGRDAGGHDEG